MELGKVGLWTHALDMQPIARAQELAAELEALGYGSILLPEMAGRDPLVFSGQLLGATQRIVIGTGIAGIWSRDALTMNGGQKALTEAFLISMAPDDPGVVERKARWLVRVMTSLLVFPGHDEADERAMIEQFVVPVVVPATQDAG
jgi:hypothetical protein